MNYVQEYLQCYAQLTVPEKSKQANRRLLQIEASEQAWTVAHSLLTSADSKLHPHGCQLLSKKLNSPLPKTLSASSLLQFLYSLPDRNSQQWLCMAKLLLHINLKQCCLPSAMTTEARLGILKQIPSAIAQIRTEPALDEALTKKSYFEVGKSLFLECFDSHRKQVLKCLDSFVSYNTRIESEALVRKLLQQPLAQIGFVLEQILAHEKYPQLQRELISYIEGNSQEENIFDIHLAFYGNVDLGGLSGEQFTKMLAFTINRLKREGESAALQDTFEFWQKIASEMNSHRLTVQQVEIGRQAFQILWDLICVRSQLKQLPVNCKIAESSLSIDVDDEVGEEYCPAVSDVNIDSLGFRDTASDFIMLCLSVARESAEMLVVLFQKLLKLCCGSVLNLQLGIFVLVTVADTAGEQLVHAQEAVTTILKREAEYNEFLCSKVIDLIGKLHSFLQACPDMLPYGLSFLARALNYQNLAPLASESCCELLEEVKAGVSVGFAENIETFLSHIYDILFQGMLRERVIENLSKAMVIFIFKFKNSPEYYQQFLEILSGKIGSLEDKERRAKYIESAIVAQLWLNARDDSKLYLKPFEHFLQSQIQFLMFNISSATRKPKLTEAINLVNMAIKTMAVSNSAPWIGLVNQIMLQFLHVKPTLPIVITPLINLAKIVEQLNQEEAIGPVVKLLGVWQPRVTALLSDIRPREVEFNLSNVVLQLHLAIVRLFLLSNSYYALISYSPAQILAFIATTLTSQIWEYELFKHALTYYHLALQLGCPPEPIIGNVLQNYGKLSEVLWTSVQPIIFLVHKRYGIAPILNALKRAKATLNEENPLWSSFQEALVRSETKTVKNLLLSIT